MRVVVMCCLCEKVFDDMDAEMVRTRWKERNRYLAKYQLKIADICIAHGYCPDCLNVYRAFLALPKGHPSEKEERA